MFVHAGPAGMAAPVSLSRQTRPLKVARTMPKVLLRCNSGATSLSYQKKAAYAGIPRRPLESAWPKGRKK
ncbi:hypothetical protein HYPDE_29453 [Hyphomicrobium denitrificans 1NES1]|uniref:Uncharacterized protein n=1 Tax=Hyphomicrobium denitrificans 1NES1 TaxID=670307 RepID=N0BAN1_9HYPH|nr:hypothetical protein HYPDE_29453 [Hyphomicrobium denitrificans 1NES1]